MKNLKVLYLYVKYFFNELIIFFLSHYFTISIAIFNKLINSKFLFESKNNFCIDFPTNYITIKNA